MCQFFFTAYPTVRTIQTTQVGNIPQQILNTAQLHGGTPHQVIRTMPRPPTTAGNTQVHHTNLRLDTVMSLR